MSDDYVILDEEIDRVLSQQSSPPTTRFEADDLLLAWYPTATFDSCARFLEASKVLAGDAWIEYTKEQAREMGFAEIIPEQIENILSSTIAKDRINKIVLYYLTVLNYTDADQHNIGFSSASSTGKSHIALEVMQYFPPEDVKELAYVSKQAFFHESGTLVNMDGKPLSSRAAYVVAGIDDLEESFMGLGTVPTQRRTQERQRLKAEWNDIPKKTQIDLHQKILVFIDQPSDELLSRLRPLASHDKKRITSKITDKNASGSNRTKTVEIIGYPTFIHLTTGFSADEQERTRFVLLSAEVSQEKIRSALTMVGQKEADRQAFKHMAEYHPMRHRLQVRTKFIKYADIEQVTIPDAILRTKDEQFLARHKDLAPRALRDFPHLLALIKANALINLFQRDIIDNCVIATEADAEIGHSLYNEIAESNELGIPPVAYEFLKKKIEPELDGEGLTRRDLRRMYYEYFKHRVSERRLVSMIENFCEIGLIDEMQDPDDRRQKRIYPAEVRVDDGQDTLEGGTT